MRNIVRVESEVPFGQLLYARLYLNQQDIKDVARHDKMEERYLAWETVRKQINPFFQNGTGFEGYLVGRTPDPEAALEEIIQINQNILDAITRYYRFQHNFRSRLIKTLNRENSDPYAIHVWSAYLGAELAKLRAKMISNNEACRFQTHTYKIIQSLPAITYLETGVDVKQTYVIGSDNGARFSKLTIVPSTLKPCHQDAWMVAQNIGEFGHPLVRKVLDQA